MERTEKAELTVLCLLFKGSRILLQNRQKQDWRGLVLPGGHVERNESIVDAVIREMKEETGYTIYHPKLCGIKQFPIQGGRYLVFLFKTDRFTGTLRSSPEGEVAWFDRSELSELDTVADFHTLLSVFDDEDLTEFIYTPAADAWDISLR